MASYSSNENIMLSGQSAYFKKTGTMVNHGTLDFPNALTAKSYSEGYIGPDSILRGTDLAETPDYINAEANMKDYLDTNWIEIEGERTLISNSQVIQTILAPGIADIQSIVDSIE